MNRRQFEIFLSVAVAATVGKVAVAQSIESNAFIQANISAAKIVKNDNRYVIDIAILATDIEQMFQKYAQERVGVDLSPPGTLEREIGRLVGSRIEMRDDNKRACTSKVEQSGEDPTNDEGVLVVQTFECTGSNIVYDATKLLEALGPRAWQVVTIIQGSAKRQLMINSNSPPVSLSE